MRFIMLSALPLLGLTGCSEPAAPEPARPEIDVSPASLGGVVLNQPIRALGNEPFWAVEITPDHLAYSGVDRPRQQAANPGPVIQGTTALYSTATDTGQALTVTLIATVCSDGMSDRTYPLTARVEIGGETLMGCAAAVSALTPAGESGPGSTPAG